MRVHSPGPIFLKIEGLRRAYHTHPPKMPTLPEINFVPYSTEIALLPLPSCALRPHPMFQPESRTLTALWFIITWPIFITWLTAKVCFKEPTRADHEEVVLDKPEAEHKPEADAEHKPEPEPDAEPDAEAEPMDLSEPICELLRLGGFTARELLLDLRDQADAGCLTSDGSPLAITKHDVNSCLYSLKAKSILTSRWRTKKSPLWSLVTNDSTFTLYELSAFDYPLEDPEYAANSRGDVINSKWEYAGHFDFKTRVHNPFATKPSDWETIM